MEKKKAATRFYMRKIDNLLNVQKIVTIHYQEGVQQVLLNGEDRKAYAFLRTAP